MKTTLSLVGLSLLIPTTAFAYLDPGSGHLIWQYVLSILLGGMFFFGQGFRWIKDGFKKLFSLFSQKPKDESKKAESN